MQATTPKPFVFVLMPFDAVFDDVYALGIKAACAEAGAYCERVDEQLFEGSMLDRIYNQIAKADLIVADMTGRNANVFYEAGYAHALGKRTVLLTQRVDDIPFDLAHYPHIVYEGRITELKAELGRRLAWAIVNPTRQLTDVEPGIEVYHGGTRIETDATLTLPYYNHNHGSPFRLDLHNAANVATERGAVRLALLCASLRGAAGEFAVMPDGAILARLPFEDSIFPGGWASATAELLWNNGMLLGEVYPATVRLSTRVGLRDTRIGISFEVAG